MFAFNRHRLAAAATLLGLATAALIVVGFLIPPLFIAFGLID